MKKIFIFIFLIPCFILFSSQDVLVISLDPYHYILQPKIQYEEGIFQLFRNLTIEYPDFLFKYAEFDLALKFLFNEKDCQIPSLQKEYEEILFVFNPLFDQQFEAFKLFFITYLKSHKKIYQFDETRLDNSHYLKDRFKVIFYDLIYALTNYEKTFYLIKDQFKVEAKKLNYYNIKANFDERVDSFLYYFCLMIKQIKPINEFFIKYINTLSNYKQQYYFNEIFEFTKTSFSIKNKDDLKIYINILPEIYVLKEENGNKYNYLTRYDVQNYEKKYDFAFYSSALSELFFGLNIFKSKTYFLHLFINGLVHYFQSYSSFIYDEKYNKTGYIKYLPLKFGDFSGWHRFLSSFKNTEKYLMSEFDADFTEYYIADLFCKKFPQLLPEDDRENISTVNKIFIGDISKLLYNRYIEYCKTNKITQMFYSQNADLTYGINTNNKYQNNPNNENAKKVLSNLTEFFMKFVYPDRNKIFYDIYRANKFFGFLLDI